MRTSPALSAAVIGLICHAAAGQEVEFKNDGLVDGGTAAIQLGFVNGEIGAATFVVPADLWPIQVLRVQFFWKSFFGNAQNSVQEAIHIYRGKGPNQLELVFSSDPPQLTDGFLNEFDLSNENIVLTKPAESSTFTVGLEFADAPNGDFNKASLVTDTDGCQPGLNPLFAIPGGWKDLCQFGASGDFVIRAIVKKVEDEPACPPDLDGNGALNLFDFLAFVSLFNAGDMAADFDGNGVLNLFDFLAFNNQFNEGC